MVREMVSLIYGYSVVVVRGREGVVYSAPHDGLDYIKK